MTGELFPLPNERALWGVCTLTTRPGVVRMMLHDQTFADESMIEKHDWHIWSGCKVEAERAARRWPLGYCLVVRCV